MLVVHLTTLPPPLPVPLHCCTVMGIAGLTEPGVTVQASVAPPPLAEPLHWVTVAPVALAGNGEQLTFEPPPAPEPLHWLTVTGVTGLAPGVSARTLFTMRTWQLTFSPPTLSESLHWRTVVTRFTDWVRKVPLPGGHGSSAHSRVTVVVDPRVLPSIVFTTSTVQTIEMVAPPGPGPMPLHWSIAMLAARAADGSRVRPTTENAPVSMIRATTAARQVRGQVATGCAWVVMPAPGSVR